MVLIEIYLIGFFVMFIIINPESEGMSIRGKAVEKFLCSVAWPFGLFVTAASLLIYSLIKDKFDSKVVDNLKPKSKQPSS
jgi:hypothetical protein